MKPLLEFYSPSASLRIQVGDKRVGSVFPQRLCGDNGKKFRLAFVKKKGLHIYYLESFN